MPPVRVRAVATCGFYATHKGTSPGCELFDADTSPQADGGTCKPVASSYTTGAECCTGKCNATTLVCETVLR